MSVLATSSDRTAGRAAVGVPVVVALAFASVAALPASSTVLVTVEEALAAAFPDAELVRESLFLDDDQLERAEELAGRRPHSGLVTRYRAIADGQLVGWAYLDTHRVRTLPETLMIVISPDAVVVRVEVVAFREPLEYIPPDGWYEQFDDRVLDDELELKRAIRPVTGATLTARATTDAVRRVLAIHRAVTGTGPEGVE
jgi:hypothetical protein